MSAPIDVESLRRQLEVQLEGEVRFDAVSRALYSTDASVYRIPPIGVVVVKSREDVIRTVRLCRQHRCPLTMRGGGTSQAGQAIGSGLIVDTSKFFNRLLEVDVEGRWARVEPGIVLDELNAALRPHALRFAPDISTASRATLGGMMANNSAGARSVIYGKTIDHVLEQQVVLSDGSLVHFGPVDADTFAARSLGDSLEARCYREVRATATRLTDEIERRYPKVIRRVGGYNLDAFTGDDRPLNMSRIIVGSEGTLGVVVEARVALVPLPKAKAVLAIQFADLLEALGATPAILAHNPSAIEVMDRFILDHTKQSPPLERARQKFISGDPAALLCVEMYDDRAENLLPRLEALERDLAARKLGYRYVRAIDAAAQAAIWSLREAALGLSMAMKGDAKSLSFVEDTAVAPERLRDYIERFLQMVRAHGTSAGVYAHASVGCLHVRPVVNLKTEAGVRSVRGNRKRERGSRARVRRRAVGRARRRPGAQSVHGEDVRARAVRRVPAHQAHLRSGGNLQSGKDRRRSAAHQPVAIRSRLPYGGAGHVLRLPRAWRARRRRRDVQRARRVPQDARWDDVSVVHGDARRSPFDARPRQRPAAGDGGTARPMPGSTITASIEVLDLCLECRACKTECPVGVDVARFKSEFLAGFHERHGTPLGARALGHVHAISRWGSRFAPLSNSIARSGPARWLNERMLGLDRRRVPPAWATTTFASRFKSWARANGRRRGDAPAVAIFNDTFTNYYNPAVGIAGAEVLDALGFDVSLAANVCCGRPLISQGLLAEARRMASVNTDRLFAAAESGTAIAFFEPSCLSAIAEDVPALLRGDDQRRALKVAEQSMLFEEIVERGYQSGQTRLPLAAGPSRIVLHGHCHQKAMGRVAPTRALLSRIPGAQVNELDSGCCGMAGSFGYHTSHFDVSRSIGERRVLPAARQLDADSVMVAGGVSCRHQIADFTGVRAWHPAELVRSLVTTEPS